MNIFNLLDSESRPYKIYDICIIGGGTVGLYLANKLVKLGNKVVICEAGDLNPVLSTNIGMDPIFTDSIYSAAQKGRSFGLGGTSVLWGGQLIPFSKYDVNLDVNGWINILSTIDKYSKNVYKTLGIDELLNHFLLADYYLKEYSSILSNNNFVALVSEWLPFNKRNFSYLLKGLNSYDNLDIYINSIVTSWAKNENSDNSSNLHVKSIIAKSINGNSVNIYANKFIIAAGSIESTRILLEINKQLLPNINTSNLGHFLSDHLSASIATVNTNDFNKIKNLFSPRLKNGRLRTFRFIDSSLNSFNQKGFYHFIFNQNSIAFDIIRNFMYRKNLELPKLKINQYYDLIYELSLFLFNKYYKNKLFISEKSTINIQFDFEQMPKFSNSISLIDELDCFGRKKININWKISDEDYCFMKTAAINLFNNWPKQELNMDIFVKNDFILDSSKLYDTYHPVGTCKIGNKNEGVVNTNLVVHGYKNLFLISTGIFPSAGTANPTFSLLCYAEFLADFLGKSKY